MTISPKTLRNVSSKADAAKEREAPHLIFSGHFGQNPPGILDAIRGALVDGADYSMHLADLAFYLGADRRLVALCASPAQWAEKAILNVAHSGKFSSDRTIAEYAREIWNVAPCPVLITHLQT
jgi:starch phosphorylase